MTKICVPIKEKKNKKVIKRIEEASKSADIIEIWLDQIQDLNLPKLFEIKTRPYLVVVKDKGEKGLFNGSIDDKIELLNQCIDLGAEYVDISFDTDIQYINRLKKCNLILSYHNFSATPETEHLNTIIKEMKNKKADIIKIAVTPKTDDDIIRVINLSKILNKYILISMGDKGKITRIISKLLGNYMMFAPLETKHKSADGQLDVNTLKRYWDLFNN